ncbi:MAG: hypothetical protein RR327_08955 [Clostridia bacterium]
MRIFRTTRRTQAKCVQHFAHLDGHCGMRQHFTHPDGLCGKRACDFFRPTDDRPQRQLSAICRRCIIPFQLTDSLDKAHT